MNKTEYKEKSKKHENTYWDYEGQIIIAPTRSEAKAKLKKILKVKKLPLDTTKKLKSYDN